MVADKLEVKTPSAKREKDKIPKTPEAGGEVQEEEQKSRYVGDCRQNNFFGSCFNTDSYITQLHWNFISVLSYRNLF